MPDLKQFEPKQNQSLEGAITEEEALAQWELFSDEYSIGELAKNAKDAGDAEDSVMIMIRNAMIRFIRAGWVEIKEDQEEGVIIVQHLKLKIKGYDKSQIVYPAPMPGQMATAGVGRDEKMANSIRYMKLASAVSGINEPTMGKIKGGDRSRMEVIGSLFLRA